tara:strand:- start:2092 stop:2463 length:372 start_codon:yes stop_codon:yes gene_type:complete
MVDIDKYNWPDSLTKTAFVDCFLEECDENIAKFHSSTIDKSFILTFKETNYSDFTLTELEFELKEFLKFNIQDMIELSEAIDNNPIIGTGNKNNLKDLFFPIILTQIEKINFRFISEIIKENN